MYIPGDNVDGGTEANPSITLKNIVRPDDGVYICELGNAAGETLSREISLEVQCESIFIILMLL